ncbi:alpha/beta hydrolase [Umezawaea sp.]|uniref:alpha/beta hydrolase n=1 Tax=Umezawaea sp. TaxID=1955258 RepID=UPI002ED0C615
MTKKHHLLAAVLVAAASTVWVATAAQSRPSAPEEARDPATTPAYARFYRQQPDWQPCGPAGAECTNVTVPVDWARPAGAAVELAVARLRGEGRGSLLVNPGGPGRSGIDFLFGGQVRGHAPPGYDLVSWDPRGVGGSAPLTCPAEASEAVEEVDGSPDTPAEVEAYEAAVGRWAHACRQASGPIFDHVDTGSTVRDMDVLRAVLGQPRLDYLGISYGTVMGGRYAETFPKRVGRVVLDSAGHPDQTYGSWMAGVAEAKEQALTAYLTGCADRPACPFATIPPDAARAWIQQLVRDTDSRPIRGGDQVVNQARLMTALTRDVSDQNGRERLDEELAGVLAGDASTLAATTRGPTIDIGNTATTCQDLPDPRTAAQVRGDATGVARTAPVYGLELTSGAPCRHWPAPAPVPPHRLRAPGVAPVLVIGITGDTAGPYRWSTELTAQLDNARLLTLDGSGHGAYLLSRCVRGAVNTFLTTGVLPPAGEVCRAG